MRYPLVLEVGGLLALTVAVVACRREPVRVPAEEKPMDSPAPAVGGTLKARVVSWDVGFKPATEAEWVERVVAEVRDASAAGVYVLVFSELFGFGLSPYAPKERYCEFITRRMRAAVLYDRQLNERAKAVELYRDEIANDTDAERIKQAEKRLGELTGNRK